MIVIVDTNVAVVANGKSEQASAECVLECVRSLNAVMKDDKIALDDKYLIITEYKNRLRSEGQPGVGDQFLRWVLLNQKTTRIEFAPIEPINDEKPSFKEFPSDERLNKFDISDRKFVAVARAHPEHPPILNAVDTDWWHFREILEEHGIKVEFLCFQDVQRFAESS